MPTPNIEISSEVKSILESRGIRAEDVSQVIEHAEGTGEKIYRKEVPNRYLAKLRINEVTFYVDYSIAGGDTYIVHTAYSHRTKMEEE